MYYQMTLPKKLMKIKLVLFQVLGIFIPIYYIYIYHNFLNSLLIKIYVLYRSILAEHLDIDSGNKSKNNSLGTLKFYKCNEILISNKQ